MRIQQIIIAFSLLLMLACKPSNNRFKPGKIWPDNNGVHINAHGGGILLHDNIYYWFGEHKVEGKVGNKALVGVHCYSSKNLYDWNDEGVALEMTDDTTSLLVSGCIVERPKVIYNAKTKKFVMWFHHELKGMGYEAALTGVAVSDKATGPYKYVSSVNPNKGIWPINYPDSLKTRDVNLDKIKPWSPKWEKEVELGAFLKRDLDKGQMARDMTLFVDSDGKAYHIHSSEENQTLHISELNDKYTDFNGVYSRVLPGKANEAPAIFKKGGKYYMITSGCTGWKPNPGRSAVADHPLGPWTELGNPCRGDEEGLKTTFHSQSTYILPVAGKLDAFIYLGDRWTPKNAINGRYIWLPIKFDKGLPTIKWYDEWDLSVFDN